MSKRHRKTKDFLNAGNSDSDFNFGMLDFDADVYETSKTKKPKGKHRREAHRQKRAYYD